MAASYRKGSFLFGLKQDKPHGKLIQLHHDNGKPDENPRRKAKGPYYRFPKGTSIGSQLPKGTSILKKLLVLLITIVILITGVSVASAASTPVFDIAKLENGVVAVSYDSGSSSRLKLSVEKNGKKINYDLQNDGTIEHFPLQMGEGTYIVSVLENTEGKSYRYISSKTIELDLTNDNSVYLASVQNINWNYDMQAIKKAAELTKGMKTDKEKINAIYKYLVDNFDYDYDKLGTLTSTYIPDIDETLSSGRGICYDYSSLMAAMLRSQGIPAKLVKGYSPLVTGYHAWNEIYDSESGEWIVVDSTYDSQMKAQGRTYSMEKTKTQYSKNYEY